MPLPGVLRGPGGSFRNAREVVSTVAGVSWDAVSASVALLAAEHADAGVGQAAIIDGIPPEQVITALTLIAGTTLRTVVGREGATGFLRDVGLRVAAEAAR